MGKSACAHAPDPFGGGRRHPLLEGNAAASVPDLQKPIFLIAFCKQSADSVRWRRQPLPERVPQPPCQNDRGPRRRTGREEDKEGGTKRDTEKEDIGIGLEPRRLAQRVTEKGKGKGEGQGKGERRREEQIESKRKPDKELKIALVLRCSSKKKL